MKDLTLVVPAKNETECLPKVLDEIKNLECEIMVVLEREDLLTQQAIKNYSCKIVFQNNKGYGDAIITGFNQVKTKYSCIYNADGSFDPKYLNEMLKLCGGKDYIFGSRYLDGAGSDDDTILTRIGNFVFSKLGNILFSVNLTDILYTYILGKTESFKSLKLKSNDFCLCVEIPINAKKMKASYIDIPSYERRRIAGKKKVNEFKDGLKILVYMLKRFLKL